MLFFKRTAPYVLALSLLSAGGSLEAAQDKAEPTWKMGSLPSFTSADGSSSFGLLGFVHADAVLNSGDDALKPDGTALRRVRVGAKGKVANDWAYAIRADFGRGLAELYDAEFSYKGVKDWNFRGGQFKEPFGLEWSTPAPWWTFMDRSLVAALAPKRAVGGSVSTGGERWRVTGAWFGSAANMKGTPATDGAVTVRAHGAPILEKDRTVHVGLSASVRQPDPLTGTARFKAKHETSLAAKPLLDTGAIASVDHLTLLNAELLGVWGPISVQSEVLRTQVSRSAGLANATFTAFYVQTSWMLTGERRPYSLAKGGLGRIKPKSSFNLSGGGTGAWEVAARYDRADLTSGIIVGGTMDRVTVGVNWYANQNIKLTANYVFADANRPENALDGKHHAFGLRAQLAF